MSQQWTPEGILALARSYQSACVLAAAADHDVFNVLARRPMSAEQAASVLQTDTRATTILLDALTALGLLAKTEGTYSVPQTVAGVLTDDGTENVLPMVCHQANCLRRWARLSEAVQTGKPARHDVGPRGDDAAQTAFIGAMHNASGPIAADIVSDLGPLTHDHLLDIGGASGTWTLAFLRAAPSSTATLFDLPHVIPMAEARIADAGMAERVRLVAGDFYTDDLPGGADLAWLGAIAHQNSRAQNRELFAKVHAALRDDGVLLIRDVVMDPSRTTPPGGALFAVNMLTATDGGGTYTLDEYRADLESAGFTNVQLARRGDYMDSVIRAEKRVVG